MAGLFEKSNYSIGTTASLAVPTERKELKTAIFMMGLPASGKSTYARKTFPAMTFLDCDAIKASHPDYDPKNPALLHDWSKKVLEVQFSEAILAGDDFVFDGTGTNFAPLIQKIRIAEGAGFETKLIYVTVPLSVSLERNSKRVRVVPEWIIRDKAESISIAFEIVSKEVNTIEVVDNSSPI